MGHTIKATQGEDFIVLPKDLVITVRVDETKVETIPGKNGNDPWEKLDFKFTITNVANEQYSEAVGQTIWGGVAFRLTDHPDNRLKQWVEALLGIEVSEGFELDTDMLSHRTARAIVDNYPRKTGGFAHKVGALLPATDPGQAAASAALGGQSAPQPAPQPVEQQRIADADVPF
jgi:hypothetical protein